MYIFSFNINQKIGNDTSVLTEYPTILTNENLDEIIFQIRTIIKEHFLNLSTSYSIPLSDMKLGISSIYKNNTFVSMHSFSINLLNVRETKEIIKDINENV